MAVELTVELAGGPTKKGYLKTPLFCWQKEQILEFLSLKTPKNTSMFWQKGRNTRVFLPSHEDIFRFDFWPLPLWLLLSTLESQATARFARSGKPPPCEPWQRGRSAGGGWRWRRRRCRDFGFGFEAGTRPVVTVVCSGF